jgi:hypothetical protein
MPRTAPTRHNFTSDNHALYAATVLRLMAQNGLPVTPVLDGDNSYTNRVELALPSTGGTITLLIPPPPDTWRFDPTA